MLMKHIFNWETVVEGISKTNVSVVNVHASNIIIRFCLTLFRIRLIYIYISMKKNI